MEQPKENNEKMPSPEYKDLDVVKDIEYFNSEIEKIELKESWLKRAGELHRLSMEAREAGLKDLAKEILAKAIEIEEKNKDSLEQEHQKLVQKVLQKMDEFKYKNRPNTDFPEKIVPEKEVKIRNSIRNKIISTLKSLFSF